MRFALATCLLLSCAPKRVEPPVHMAQSTPIATRLVAPDGGPFDFSQRPEEEEKVTVSGDMSHPGQVPGMYNPINRSGR